MKNVELGLALAAARAAGLPVEKASIHRRSSSITVELHGVEVMARVEGPEAAVLAERQVAVARLLAERVVPAARLVVPEMQPFLFEDGAVTLWQRLTILPGKPEPAAVARLARRLHDATRGELPAEIPRFDPFPRIRADLARAAGRTPGGGIGELVAECEMLAGGWRETASQDPLGTGLVHGDFHVENVVSTPEGPVILDLEDAGWGPATWDLVPQIAAVRRYGTPEDACETFFEAYGPDPRAWEGAESLCRSYELLLVAWALAVADTMPGMADEAELRLASYRGETDRPWTMM